MFPQFIFFNKVGQLHLPRSHLGPGEIQRLINLLILCFIIVTLVSRVILGRLLFMDQLKDTRAGSKNTSSSSIHLFILLILLFVPSAQNNFLKLGGVDWKAEVKAEPGVWSHLLIITVCSSTSRFSKGKGSHGSRTWIKDWNRRLSTLLDALLLLGQNLSHKSTGRQGFPQNRACYAACASGYS